MTRLYTCEVCSAITTSRHCPQHPPREASRHWSPNRDRGAQARFRKAVLERDHYRCTICGASQESTNLVAAHVKPLRDFQAGDPAAYDPRNGRTVCEDCDVETDPFARRRGTRNGSFVALGGTPGAGKSTLAIRLRDELGFAHLAADDVRVEITGDKMKWSPLVWAEMASRGRVLLQTRDLVIESTGASSWWPSVVEQLEDVASASLVVVLHGSEPVARSRGRIINPADHRRLAGIVATLDCHLRLNTDNLSKDDVFAQISNRIAPQRLRMASLIEQPYERSRPSTVDDPQAKSEKTSGSGIATTTIEDRRLC